MTNYQKINGLVAAVFTPFHKDGKINPDAIPAYAARMKKEGMAGVFVNGSSGEGMLLSVQERKILAEKWVGCADNNFKIIVHTGSSSIEIVKDLASHAQSIGADAVATMAPNFFPSADVDVMADYCSQAAAAARQTPFYYYHLPVATGCHIKVHQLLEKASGKIPNLVGVKYTHTDFMDMHQCLAMDNGRFDVLHGHDEILLSGLVLGVQGAIGTSFNFMPGVYHNIISCFQRNDLALARKHQLQSVKMVKIMLKYVNAIVGGKAIMNFTGIDLGPCRTPLRNLEPAELGQLKTELTEAGFFELIKGSIPAAV